MPGWAYLFGLGVVAMGVVVVFVVSGGNPSAIIIGADGRPSCSSHGPC